MEFSAFFNPFNVAIKTGKSDEGGHKISFVYPKKSRDVTINVKTETINEHKIDFASLISSFARFLPLPGQGFSLPFHPFKKATTTTTTEANDLFGDDESSEGATSWDSSSGDSGDSTSTSNDKPLSDDTNDEVDDSSNVDVVDVRSEISGKKKCNCKEDAVSGSAGGFSMEAADISYIPPKTVNEYFAPVSGSSAASPVQINYLPPK